MSDNPYKGIPGGDPRFRDARKKNIVSIAFICATCNQNKTEKLPEGKDVTGRICTDCRNAESVRKQKIRDEENRLRWEEYLAKERLRPNRTKEEMLALIAEYSSCAQETCGACAGKFLIHDPAFPFANDNIWKDNAIMTVTYCLDPYDLEIRNEENPGWLCRNCYKNLEWDI